MAVLEPLFKPVKAQPASTLNLKIPALTLLFNNFQYSSWLLAAAVGQGLLTWLFPTVLTFLPALLVLSFRILDTVLVMAGYRENPYMRDVIPQRISAQVPNGTGDFGEKPSGETVVVLMLGSRSNHPLGIMYSEYRKLYKFFAAMVRDLESNREEYGFITSNAYLSNADPNRNAARELMTMYYFRSLEGLHKFAHGPVHREGWIWWNKTTKEHPDISIMHEVYEAPAGSWENVYVNYHPTGFATGRYPIKLGEKDFSGQGEEAETKWVSNIVDGSGADMRSAKLRMGRE